VFCFWLLMVCQTSDSFLSLTQFDPVYILGHSSYYYPPIIFTQTTYYYYAQQYVPVQHIHTMPRHVDPLLYQKRHQKWLQKFLDLPPFSKKTAVFNHYLWVYYLKKMQRFNFLCEFIPAPPPNLMSLFHHLPFLRPISLCFLCCHPVFFICDNIFFLLLWFFSLDFFRKSS